MKERIRELLSKRESFDVDVAKDLGNGRIGVTRYMDTRVSCDDKLVNIDGLGEYGFDDHQMDISHFNFITIKRRNGSDGDSITIM